MPRESGNSPHDGKKLGKKATVASTWRVTEREDPRFTWLSNIAYFGIFIAIDLAGNKVLGPAAEREELDAAGPSPNQHVSKRG